MDAIMEVFERRGRSGAETSPGDPDGQPPGLEGRYQAAKARLLAAQQEKTEAAVEFLAVRAALRAAVCRRLERLWPGEGAWSDAEMAAGV